MVMFLHIRTEKAQTSLRIRAVYTEPVLHFKHKVGGVDEGSGDSLGL